MVARFSTSVKPPPNDIHCYRCGAWPALSRGPEGQKWCGCLPPDPEPEDDLPTG